MVSEERREATLAWSKYGHLCQPENLLEAGAAHGCHDEDLAGCLFFHVKAALASFAWRARAGRVHVLLTHCDASELAQRLASTEPEVALQPFCAGGFARVDLATLLDELPKDVLFDRFGPLLDASNPHAALIVRTAKWHAGRRGARAWSAALNINSPADTDPAVLDRFQRQTAAYLVSAFVVYDSS